MHTNFIFKANNDGCKNSELKNNIGKISNRENK